MRIFGCGKKSDAVHVLRDSQTLDFPDDGSTGEPNAAFGAFGGGGGGGFGAQQWLQLPGSSRPRSARDMGELSRKYTVGGVIGIGGDATVYVVTRKSDGVRLACKFIDRRKPRCETNDAHAVSALKISAAAATAGGRAAMRAARVDRELDVHSRLPRHAHIVPCLEVFTGSGSHCHMILGLCEGGTLLDVLSHERAARALLTESGAADIAGQVLAAVEFLHGLGVVHRDIKLENLMVAARLGADRVHVQLADFGCARYFESPATEPAAAAAALDPPRLGRQATLHVGTLAYMAPEQLLGGSTDAALDMWSFAIVLSALCTGRHPLADVDHGEWLVEMRLNRLPAGASEAARQSWAPLPAARDLAERILRLDPAERLTAAQALRHGWIVSQGGKKSCAKPTKPVRSRRIQRSLPDFLEKPPSFYLETASDPPVPTTDCETPSGVNSWRRKKSRAERNVAKGKVLLKSNSKTLLKSSSKSLLKADSSRQPAPPGMLRRLISRRLSRGSRRTAVEGPPLVEAFSKNGFYGSDDDSSLEGSDLRLKEVLRGLRECQRTRLQKLLHLLVALRADDSETAAALELFSRLVARRAAGRAYLDRDDVEEALSHEDISARVADELCDVFETLSLDGSGRVSVAEFVAGALSLQRAQQADVMRAVLRPLTDAHGRISAGQLAKAFAAMTTVFQTSPDGAGKCASRGWGEEKSDFYGEARKSTFRVGAVFVFGACPPGRPRGENRDGMKKSSRRFRRGGPEDGPRFDPREWPRDGPEDRLWTALFRVFQTTPGRPRPRGSPRDGPETAFEAALEMVLSLFRRGGPRDGL